MKLSRKMCNIVLTSLCWIGAQSVSVVFWPSNVFRASNTKRVFLVPDFIILVTHIRFEMLLMIMRHFFRLQWLRPSLNSEVSRLGLSWAEEAVRQWSRPSAVLTWIFSGAGQRMNGFHQLSLSGWQPGGAPPPALPDSGIPSQPSAAPTHGIATGLAEIILECRCNVCFMLLFTYNTILDALFSANNYIGRIPSTNGFLIRKWISRC